MKGCPSCGVGRARSEPEAASKSCWSHHTKPIPPVTAKAGIILSIVQLKDGGHLRAAAQLASRGAEISLEALGDDSSVYIKLASLTQAFGEAADAAGEAVGCDRSGAGVGT